VERREQAGGNRKGKEQTREQRQARCGTGTGTGTGKVGTRVWEGVGRVWDELWAMGYGIYGI
jgi:hypothetical protein